MRWQPGPSHSISALSQVPSVPEEPTKPRRAADFTIVCRSVSWEIGAERTPARIVSAHGILLTVAQAHHAHQALFRLDFIVD